MWSNTDIILKIFDEGWANERFGGIEDFFADHIVLHIRNVEHSTNVEELKEIIRRWKISFPDLHFEVLSIISEGDMVAANMIMRGTHLGEWKDILPTSKKIAVPHMFFFRLQEGKLFEIWEVNDFSEVEEQLGGA